MSKVEKKKKKRGKVYLQLEWHYTLHMTVNFSFGNLISFKISIAYELQQRSETEEIQNNLMHASIPYTLFIVTKYN